LTFIKALIGTINLVFSKVNLYKIRKQLSLNVREDLFLSANKIEFVNGNSEAAHA
jgi:hypothetical protein